MAQHSGTLGTVFPIKKKNHPKVVREKVNSSLGYRTKVRTREVSSNVCGRRIPSKGPILRGVHAAAPKRKKCSREGMGCAIQGTGTSNPSCSSPSLNLNWRNCLLENRDPAKITKGFGSLGKKLG